MCKTLLALHILGVFMIVGGAAIATALGIRTARSRHTRTIAELSGISIFAERFVITPGANSGARGRNPARTRRATHSISSG